MKLYTEEDIARVREDLQFVITACKIQGDKLGQLRWHTMSDSLTEALGLLDAGKDVEVAAWLVTDGEDLFASNEKGYVDSYDADQVEPLYATKEDV